LGASNNFYEFLILQGFSEKGKKITSLKKKDRAGTSDLSQAGPNPVACPG
jgi:hypothetical protein